MKFFSLYNYALDAIWKITGLNMRHILAYFLSKLFSNKVNSKIIVFGSTAGTAYTGNSRDLFEYLHEHSDYYCVWITGSEKIFNQLKSKGYNVLSNRDGLNIKVIKLVRAAEHIFITHGFGDILLVDFSPDTKIIHLDHGSALKVIGFALKDAYLNFFEKRIRDYWDKKISYLTVCSEETKRTKRFSYNLPDEKVIITGYPRNGILVNHTKEDKDKIKDHLKINKDREVIVYAPTFRKYKWKPPMLSPDFLRPLNAMLKEEKKVFLYKPHPFSKNIDLSEYENIKFIHPFEDIRDLLVIADVLITDYSGVFYDYLLTMRPIIFFAFDYGLYKEVRDFYYDYETFVPGPIVKDGKELIEMLRNIEPWGKQYENKRREIRDLFNKYIDGHAVDRILDFFKLSAKK